MLMLLAAVEIVRLTPEAAAVARADGEARAIAQYAREDAARAAKPRAGGSLGLGLGTRNLSTVYAPLGDTGGADFVYAPGSLGRTRYRGN